MTNYNDGKWHGWNGGECPVHKHSKVDVIWPDGTVKENWFAGDFSWKAPIPMCAFRVIKEHREPREFWVSNNDGYAHESLESALSDHLTEKHGYIHVREVLE